MDVYNLQWNASRSLLHDDVYFIVRDDASVLKDLLSLEREVSLTTYGFIQFISSLQRFYVESMSSGYQ